VGAAEEVEVEVEEEMSESWSCRCVGPYATSVCGLELLGYAALSY
jgi:hypothetical protein